VVRGVKVERATVRTTLTPRATTARLARVDGRRDGSAPHPPTTTRGRRLGSSISEPERPRRRHRLDPGCTGSPHATGQPTAGARGVGRAERGGDRSDGAAGRRTRARRSGSGAGCLDEVEKVLTALVRGVIIQAVSLRPSWARTCGAVSSRSASVMRMA
jgi:hypothetical protein